MYSLDQLDPPRKQVVGFPGEMVSDSLHYRRPDFVAG
jgi:hypothetical protein